MLFNSAASVGPVHADKTVHHQGRLAAAQVEGWATSVQLGWVGPLTAERVLTAVDHYCFRPRYYFLAFGSAVQVVCLVCFACLSVSLALL
jgi:hypothetical protein